MKISCLAVVSFLTALATPSTALPTGAAGCVTNDVGSVGGPHINPPDPNQIQSFTLDEIDLQVTIQYGTTTPFAAVPNETNDLEYSRPYTVSLLPKSGTSGTQFRGFLFKVRCGSEDTTTFFETVGDETPSQIATACLAITQGGVTHVNNDEKEFAQALLTIPEGNKEGQCNMQVTAVLENRNIPAGTLVGQSEAFWSSKYAYAEFPIQVIGNTNVGAGDPPSVAAPSAPVAAPSAPAPAPAAEPTSAGFSVSTVATAASSLLALVAL